MNQDDIIDDVQRVKHDLNSLRAAWTKRFREPPPALRNKDLLLRAFVYRLECQRRNGPSAVLKRRLTDLAPRYLLDPQHAPPPRAALNVGATVVREWNDERHVVHVTEDGFRYCGQDFASLSQIAKKITGTHQSGPRFFGLIGKKAPKR